MTTTATIAVTVPTCPTCNAQMTKRNGRFGMFWGCTRYNKGCRGTRQIAAIKAEVIRKAVVGSPEQDAIWDKIVNGVGHVVVNALAGSGKSFTCRESMHRLPSHLRVLYLAFNKSIVNEFKADAPSNATISTLNAIGHRILTAAFPKLELNVDKVAGIINKLIPQPNTVDEIEQRKSLCNAVETLVALCQGYLIDGNDIDAILEVADRHEVDLTNDLESQALPLISVVLKADREMTSVISYNDQLWLPVTLNLPTAKYDLIYVDEAQDLNPCQHQLVMKLLATGGRVVVVGDTNQAIYGFRGSDVNSIGNLSAILASTAAVTSLPLTVTRRCGKAIVEFAQQWVPQIQALPDAQQGEVITTYTDKASDMYTPGDMVVCRCNAPLTSEAYKLIKKGIKVVIRGRDIGQGLIALIKKLRAKSINELMVKLQAWTDKEIAKVAGSRREGTVTQQVMDKANCIYALVEGAESIADLIQTIEDIFANFDSTGVAKECVVMSSIHRAKGLEAGRVFWLLPEIKIECKQDWQAQQESNLKYVAATRAKNTLVLVNGK